MLKTLIHLDSIDGIHNYDTILKGYHCYNTNININKPIRNIKEISLKSLEMPIFLIILDHLIEVICLILHFLILH